MPTNETTNPDRIDESGTKKKLFRRATTSERGEKRAKPLLKKRLTWSGFLQPRAISVERSECLNDKSNGFQENVHENENENANEKNVDVKGPTPILRRSSTRRVKQAIKQFMAIGDDRRRTPEAHHQRGQTNPE
jgi:hypothetical protein